MKSFFAVISISHEIKIQKTISMMYFDESVWKKVDFRMKLMMICVRFGENSKKGRKGFLETPRWIYVERKLVWPRHMDGKARQRQRQSKAMESQIHSVFSKKFSLPLQPGALKTTEKLSTNIKPNQLPTE